MKWAGHMAFMVEERNVYSVLVEGPKERNHLEERSVDGRM
jgi:hypothetical protein